MLKQISANNINTVQTWSLNFWNSQLLHKTWKLKVTMTWNAQKAMNNFSYQDTSVAHQQHKKKLYPTSHFLFIWSLASTMGWPGKTVRIHQACSLVFVYTWFMYKILCVSSSHSVQNPHLEKLIAAQLLDRFPTLCEPRGSLVCL